MKVSGEIQADGHAVTLTLVRVELGMLRGLDESMLQVLEDFGAIQDAPVAVGHERCLSMAKSDTEHFSGGGFGGTENFQHVMLLPDGRRLRKALRLKMPRHLSQAPLFERLYGALWRLRHLAVFSCVSDLS